MSAYKIQKTLPHPDTVKQELPRTPELTERVHRDRQEICDILTGKDPRKIIVIGPCSAWPENAVIEYAKKLQVLSEKFSDTLKIVLRVYTQKPRTTVGWTGPLTQPDPFAKPDIENGIYYCRKMMLEALEIGLPLADEALFTHNDGYFVDLLSWVAVGARSAEDQEHRTFASMIGHPTGLKNPTSGDISVGVNSVVSAQHPHIFALHGQQVETSGNPYAHLILRGGNGKTNYDQKNLMLATKLLHEKGVLNPSIILDASHDNAIDEVTGKKDYLLQEKVVLDVLETMKKDPQIRSTIKGFMCESFLVDGKQNLDAAKSMKDIVYGQSVTDGCLGWERTAVLLEKIAKTL